MKRYFTKTFLRFFVGFVVIITFAFGILMVASSVGVKDVDNVAHPR